MLSRSDTHIVRFHRHIFSVICRLSQVFTVTQTLSQALVKESLIGRNYTKLGGEKSRQHEKRWRHKNKETIVKRNSEA